MVFACGEHRMVRSWLDVAEIFALDNSANCSYNICIWSAQSLWDNIMNRFVLHNDPFIAAKMHCDKHVVKMILEEAQMLSTAHRILDGKEYVDASSGRRIKRWQLPSTENDSALYKATHVGHPCTQWSMQSNNNYTWAVCLLEGLLNEYTHRYGKYHKTESIFRRLVALPRNIPVGPLTPFPQAMPDDCKRNNPVDGYRAYYREHKKAFAKWSKREQPEWWV